MRNRALTWLAGLVVGLALFELAPAVSNLRGQPALRGSGTGFRGSETDAQGRTSSIRGQRFESSPDGLIRITGMTIENSRGSNSTMIIEVAESIFDPKNKVAFSTNTIAVRMSDGRFAIKGQGFRFGTSESRLTISNNVYSVIRKSPAKGTAASPPASAKTTAAARNAPGANADSAEQEPTKGAMIEIHSDQFDFSGEIALFNGHVRARDEDSTLSCGMLRAVFTETGNDLSRVEAERNVVFEQGGARTTSDKAVYLPIQGVVTLTGQPTWKLADMEGEGERLVINNTTREILVEREVKVRLPQRSMFPMDSPSSAVSTNTAADTNRWLLIQSDGLNYHPTGALFQGNVRVTDPQGTELTCGVLTNWFSEPGGKLAGVVVERNVEFKQSDLWVRADKGAYRTNSEFITLTGSPTWKTQQGEGKGDVLLINPKTRQIQVEGNVAMKLSGPGLVSLDLTLQKPGAGPMVRTNQEFVIVADELYYRSGSVIFLHRVKVTSPQEPENELGCEVLAAFFAGPENKLDQLVAEENVQVRQGDVRAKGEKVNYWVPKGLLELTGQPRVEEPGRSYRSDKIVFHRRDNTVEFIDNYRIELELDSIRRSTNADRGIASKKTTAKPVTSGSAGGLK